MRKKIIFVVLFPVMLFCLSSCQVGAVSVHPDPQSYEVFLRLYDYTPKIYADKYQQYRGKKICMSGIRNDAQNTTNFSYYSKDLKVRYNLSNKPNTMIQFVQSYFWYAYQKAFAHVGMEASHYCATANMPELWIIIQSFDDEELQLKINILKSKETIYEKDLLIQMPAAVHRNPVSLKLRAYEMIDLTIMKILDDQGFKEIITGAND
ncbi:MAG TPA: hypothetical protein ENN95_00800 [Deltaproteobacteria bacterium]|nr:hypothetical protein [Deltaproteobacteria bacterium]